MALGDPYVELPIMREHLGIQDHITSSDDLIAQAIDSASRQVDNYTGRQFNKTPVATTRQFEAQYTHSVNIDDAYEITKVEIDGTEVTGYIKFPRNGVMDGQEGFPTNRLGIADIPRGTVVDVTAKWGWLAVPAPVVTATKLIAAQQFKMKDAPFGVTGMQASAGGMFGGIIRVRDLPQLTSLLGAYRITPILVG